MNVGIPLLRDSISKEGLQDLRRRIGTDVVECQRLAGRGRFLVLRLSCIGPAEYVRAIQEEEMLKTKVMRGDKGVFWLSFDEAWRNNPVFRGKLLGAADACEAKWSLQQEFGYRLATNFMPMYACYVYRYFHGGSVLDPCAGWGDRLAGALSSGCVSRYVGFDPNLNVYEGYRQILSDFGATRISESPVVDEYSNGCRLYKRRFEDARRYLVELPPFDFAFTGPPFFEFEHYGEFMPVYEDWITEFYVPLFMTTHDHLRPEGYFVVYLNDTSAGKIERFMLETVPGITTFRFKGKIGLTGGSSGKLRDLYVFQRA